MKTLLGDPTMTKRMLEVEKDSITDAILRKLKKYTESPKFVPDEAGLLNIYCFFLMMQFSLQYYFMMKTNLPLVSVFGVNIITVFCDRWAKCPSRVDRCVLGLKL